MKTLRITKRVKDKETKETHESGTEIELSNKRAADYIKAGVAEEVEGDKEE